MECMSEVQGGERQDAFLGGEEYSDRDKTGRITELASWLQLEGMHDERWGRGEDQNKIKKARRWKKYFVRSA